MSEVTIRTGTTVPFKLTGGFVQRRDAASQGLKQKLVAEMKQLRASRETLVAEIMERKGRLDDIDGVLDNLASSISRIDRDALLSDGPEDNA